MSSRVAVSVAVIGAILARGAFAAPPAIQSHRLKNGLEILVVENHSVPLVTVEIAAKNGSMTEPPNYNGLSHLYEHMFFKANKVIPDQEAYLARMRQLGMEFNGSTGTERVNYFFTTTTDHLNDSMVFMRDAIVSPLFEQKELEQEKQVVIGEIDRNESNPYYHFQHEISKHVWWKYPSRKDPLGNRKTVLAATREQMLTIQRRYYIPNNSVLVVTGDTKAGDIFRQADVLYQDWKSGPDPFKSFPLPRPPPLPRSEVVLVQQPVETVTMQMVWQGPSTVGNHVELTYAADLLGYALQEPSSPFQKHLVESGACVRAGFAWSTQMNVGPIALGLEATPERADQCLKTALDELPMMKRNDYLSDEELRNAAHRLEVDQALEREKPSELAHVLTFWWCSAGLNYYLSYLDNVKRATREEIARYLDTYVLGKPYVLGAMVSPKMAADHHLDRAHFERLAGIGEGASAASAAPKGEAKR
jgi:zinc protease